MVFSVALHSECQKLLLIPSYRFGKYSCPLAGPFQQPSKVNTVFIEIWSSPGNSKRKKTDLTGSSMTP